MTGRFTILRNGNYFLKEVNMKEKVEKALDEVRPYLQMEGGNVELIDVTEDGIVKVRLKGACGSCPMSTYTLKMSIEQKIKEMVPEVKEVVAV